MPDPDWLRGAPGWAVVAAVVLGVALALAIGLRTPDLPNQLAPRRGAGDTLRGTGLTLPDPGLRTRYLERVVAPPNPREAWIRELADRYNVTEPLARMIHDAAIRERIDPELAFRLVRVESVFDEKAVGSAGALGLCQLMYGTARDIDPEITSRAQVMEPETNLRLGFTNLRNMLELFDGDVRLAVIAYNRGEVAVQRAVRRGRDPENGYGDLVLGPRAHGGQPYRGRGLLPDPASGSPVPVPARVPVPGR